jgi:hypothetical protein
MCKTWGIKLRKQPFRTNAKCLSTYVEDHDRNSCGLIVGLLGVIVSECATLLYQTLPVLALLS